MPTLQQMHKNTAASPRATAKLFLLMEELSYRHLYRVDGAHLGNFRIKSVLPYYDREDDLASNGFCGIASFTAAIFKVIEAQLRGFAHGHGKIHSLPDGSQGLYESLDNVVRKIRKLKEACRDKLPSDEELSLIHI